MYHLFAAKLVCLQGVFAGRENKVVVWYAENPEGSSLEQISTFTLPCHMYAVCQWVRMVTGEQITYAWANTAIAALNLHAAQSRRREFELVFEGAAMAVTSVFLHLRNTRHVDIWFCARLRMNENWWCRSRVKYLLRWDFPGCCLLPGEPARFGGGRPSNNLTGCLWLYSQISSCILIISWSLTGLELRHNLMLPWFPSEIYLLVGWKRGRWSLIWPAILLVA